MSSFFTKEIAQINFSDIKTLVDEKIPESSILDYKMEMITKDKLGKLITALANGSGGYIIIGISEEKKDGKNTGRPDQIIGVPQADYTNLITSIALGQTQPQIAPLINDNIIHPNFPDKFIVVIRIKESLRPIMWKNRWPIRINDQIVYADNSLMNKLFNKEKYILEKRLQNIFDNIRRNLERIRIDSDNVGPNIQTDYRYSLKQRTDHKPTNNAMLTQFQKELINYIRAFQDEWKYFGIGEYQNNIFLCYGKYGFFSKLIRVPSYLAIPRTELINTILSDMKEKCKQYYQIDLD